MSPLTTKAALFAAIAVGVGGMSGLASSDASQANDTAAMNEGASKVSDATAADPSAESVSLTSVPEPTVMGMAGIAVCGNLLRRRRRSRAKA